MLTANVVALADGPGRAGSYALAVDEVRVAGGALADALVVARLAVAAGGQAGVVDQVLHREGTGREGRRVGAGEGRGAVECVWLYGCVVVAAKPVRAYAAPA